MVRRRVSVLLPCRAGSSRVAGKNTRPFGPRGESLLEIKLKQVIELSFVHEVILSTNDPVCVDIGQRVAGDLLTVDHRPEHLCLDTTSLSDLTRHFGAIASGEYFLWTHVTSPFFGQTAYKRGYEAFLRAINKGHDSLLAVEPMQDFLIFRDKPMNFGQPENYWPRTQDLESFHRVTSGLFIGGTADLLAHGARAGNRPLFFEVTGPEALDIDWPQQFQMAQMIASSGQYLDE
ncbi:hypothetical protein N9K72_03895 [Pontimonas sp.]|nr:hypothetical protein [Pontimonas sp.]